MVCETLGGAMSQQEPAVAKLRQARGAANGSELADGEPRAANEPVSAISTIVLRGRSSRSPNYKAENRALIELAQGLSTSPRAILQKLAETAMALCAAQSAGITAFSTKPKRHSIGQ